ncbi:MAG: hypothetical protein D6681_05790 [Calditrichaeota bacterium]|nr:MAG: hypothetical protein D6681_05790 [Calditrichota bacterium]
MKEIPPDLQNVEDFLDELRSICGLTPDIDIVSRKKNTDFIEKIGLSKEEINDIIFKKLKSEHCVKGPQPEADPKFDDGVVYVFKYSHEEYTIYIKLKIYVKAYARTAICLSFHEDS